jgi:hypothetical protein
MPLARVVFNSDVIRVLVYNDEPTHGLIRLADETQQGFLSTGQYCTLHDGCVCPEVTQGFGRRDLPPVPPGLRWWLLLAT